MLFVKVLLMFCNSKYHMKERCIMSNYNGYFHNKGQEDASKSENTLLGETNYHPPEKLLFSKMIRRRKKLMPSVMLTTRGSIAA